LSRELADDDALKWRYTEHARAKHAIQWTYLGAWLPILGTRFSPLVLFDGFAGRGRYETGEDGSPLLFWKRSVEAVDAGRPREVLIRCVEANRGNYKNLCDVIQPLQHPGVKIAATHGKFAEEAAAAAARLRAWRPIPPSFWTADPYGFSGVPLETIADLMSCRARRCSSPSWSATCAASSASPTSRHRSTSSSAATHGDAASS